MFFQLKIFSCFKSISHFSKEIIIACNNDFVSYLESLTNLSSQGKNSILLIAFSFSNLLTISLTTQYCDSFIFFKFPIVKFWFFLSNSFFFKINLNQSTNKLKSLISFSIKAFIEGNFLYSA
jgi:uncharacterized membrane protein YjjP (DUF1212 family)